MASQTSGKASRAKIHQFLSVAFTGIRTDTRFCHLLWLPGWPKCFCNSGLSDMEKLDPSTSQIRCPSHRESLEVADRNAEAVFSISQ